MRAVLDSCIGFKWLVIEADTPKARSLRDDYLKAIHQLLAPDILPVEIAHSLTRAERQGRITPAEGAQFLRDMLNTLPQLHSISPFCHGPMRSRPPCASGSMIVSTSLSSSRRDV